MSCEINGSEPSPLGQRRTRTATVLSPAVDTPDTFGAQFQVQKGVNYDTKHREAIVGFLLDFKTTVRVCAANGVSTSSSEQSATGESNFAHKRSIGRFLTFPGNPWTPWWQWSDNDYRISPWRTSVLSSRQWCSVTTTEIALSSMGRGGKPRRLI